MSKRIKSLITNGTAGQVRKARFHRRRRLHGHRLQDHRRRPRRPARKKVKLTVVRNAMAVKALEGDGPQGRRQAAQRDQRRRLWRRLHRRPGQGTRRAGQEGREAQDQGLGRRRPVAGCQGHGGPGQAAQQEGTAGHHRRPDPRPGRKLAGQIKGPAGKLAGQIKKVEENAKAKEAAAPAPRQQNLAVDHESSLSTH